ncbi:MAG TPA: GFA family protein [Casimicrobiaceae bacterium]|nr:GFA family protein [Casimicrobiaceae bacterium]
MLTAICHCGAVGVQVPRKPRRLTSCNCSICRRYGTLWAYYKASDVRIVGARGATQGYAWGDKSLRFVRCGNCGCIMHWEATKPTSNSRMGVNARNLDPAAIAGVRVRRLDGASTWKFLD